MPTAENIVRIVFIKVAQMFLLSLLSLQLFSFFPGNLLFASADVNEIGKEYSLAFSARLNSYTSTGPTPAHYNNIQYQGSLMDGADEATLSTGGATLSVILSHGCTFDDTLTMAEVESLLVHSMFVKENPTSQWNMNIMMALRGGELSFAHHGRQLRVTLGPMPDFQLSQQEEVTIMLHQHLLSKCLSTEMKTGSFLIHPSSAISFITQTTNPIVGSPVVLQLTGHFDHDVSVTIIRGDTCRGERGDMTHHQILKDGIIMFTPNCGGTFSICNDFTSHETEPVASLRKIGGSLIISGPETTKADPESPKATQPFFINIFGTGLSVQDSAGLSKEGCNDSERDDFIVSDLTVTSSSRGGFHANVPTPGSYHVCYLCQGSQSYVSVGVINVIAGDETLIIDGNKRNVVIDSNTLLSRDLHLLFLTIESGTFNLGGYHLNVTYFTWTGGNIEGPGVISVMGDNSKIDAVILPKTIDFDLRNFGYLLLDIGNVHLVKSGSITNYNHLIITGNENAEIVRITAAEQKNHITTARGSTTSFRMSHVDEDYNQRIVIDPVVRNYGRFVHEEGVLVLSNLQSYKKGIIDLSSLAVMTIHSGKIQSTVSLGDWSELNIQGPMDDHDTPFKIDNANFVSDGQATINIVSGKVYLASSQFSGSADFSFGAVTEELQLSCDGVVTFGQSVSVRMSRTTFSSTYLGTLNFYGRIVFDMSSVRFGDNVVVHSRLSSVSFSSKHDNYTAILPQNMNANSSFIVPSNASLVIIDQASVKRSTDRILGAPPAICNSYVVIPMYIFAEGDEIKLSGCAMLPFGSTIKKMLYEPTAELVEVSLRYAYCKTAIFGGGECVKINEPRDPSGIFVSGPMALSGVISRLHRPQLNGFTFDGALDANIGSLDIVTQELIVRESKVMILNGEGIFNITSSHLNNQLRIDGTGTPLLIEGSVDLQHALVCNPKLQSYTNQILTTLNGIMNGIYSQCIRQLNNVDKVGGSLILLNSHGALSHNTGSGINRSGSSVSVITVSHDIEMKDFAHDMSTQGRLVCYCLALVVSVVLLALLHRNIPIIDIVRELSSSPPIQLDLMNCEMSLVINFLALSCLVIEASFLSLLAFHRNIYLSPSLVWLSHASEIIFKPYSFYGPTIADVFATLCILMGITRLPLHRNRYTEKILDYSKIFRFQTRVALFVPCLFIPILSMFIDSVLRNAASLRGFITSTGLFHLIALCLFVYCVPHNGSSSPFPFLHPPFQLDLDVRFKRVFIYIKYTLIFLLMMCWNISLPNQVFTTITSFIGVALLYLLTWYSEPCGYRNINSFCRHLFLFPLWSQTCLLGVQLLILYGVDVISDPLSDMYYHVCILCGWSLIALSMSYSLRRSVNGVFNGDAALTALLKVIIQGNDLINECVKDMYNCKSACDREVFSSNLSELYMRNLKRLTEFRRHKEVYLLPYYIGTKSANDLLHTSHGTVLDRCSTEGRFLVRNSDFLPNSSFNGNQLINTSWVLTVDMMDSFVKGDLLGSGSYGKVFRGMIDSKLIAVKEIPIKNKSKSYCDQVKKELNIHKSFIHPNVIRYYGYHSKRGCINIFMELACGSLNALAKKFVPIPERNIKLYTRQILAGLSYLHENNIAHCDIKGENILIANDNDDNSVAKIADFGCATDISQKSEEKCSPLRGSLSWMAPEVIRQKHYTTNIDIWSLGCTVVEMLNGGQSPWAESFDNLSAQIFHLGNVETPPSNIPSDISVGCRNFLSKCFERDYTKRPSALELLEDEWLLDTTPHPPPHTHNVNGVTTLPPSTASLLKTDNGIWDYSGDESSYDFSTDSFISERDSIGVFAEKKAHGKLLFTT